MLLCIFIFFPDSAVLPTEIFCVDNEVNQAVAHLLLDISYQFIIKKVSVHFRLSLSDVLEVIRIALIFSLLFYRTTYLRLPLHKLNGTRKPWLNISLLCLAKSFLPCATWKESWVVIHISLIMLLIRILRNQKGLQKYIFQYILH